MFKKLFGGKKGYQPQTLEEAKGELLESIKETSLNNKIKENLDHCLSFLSEENHSEGNELLRDIFRLAEELPAAQSVLAFALCANLIEMGYGEESDIDRMINAFAEELKKSNPFYNVLHDHVQKVEQGEAEEVIDVYSLHHELLNNRGEISQEIANSVVKSEGYCSAIVSILSISRSLIEKYKNSLAKDVAFVSDFNQGYYWLGRLLNLLFDEPVIVIDVDRNIGIEGKMNGVSDNYQLQALLMGMPELNDVPAIKDEDLKVFNGDGIHISNTIIQYKWNMYNLDIIHQEDWQEIKIGPAKTIELQDFWIWGEGTPEEITVHNEKRVILLGRTPIKRQSRVQRSFKNVKASVEVDKILTEEEIDNWLQLVD